MKGFFLYVWVYAIFIVLILFKWLYLDVYSIDKKVVGNIINYQQKLLIQTSNYD